MPLGDSEDGRGPVPGGDGDRTRAADGADGPVEVLVLPDYREANPYQRELEAALEDRDVAVRTATGPGLLAPITRTLLDGGVPDVVHLHFFSTYVVTDNRTVGALGLRAPVTLLLGVRLLIELALARALGARLVWTAHDLLNHERRAVRVEVAIKHVAVRFLLDRVIVHCARADDLLVDTYRLPDAVREKFVVVPHGHFADAYPNGVDRSTARERLGLPTDATVLCYFGIVRPYKNVPLLIETFGRLDDDDARLLVVGNPRSEALETAVRERARTDDRVETVLEFVPDDEIQHYLTAADAVVVPFETDERTLLTSGSVLLAMSFGRAVIAPRLGCVAETVDGRGGFLYESTRGDELREAMERALDDGSDLDAMGAHSRERIRRCDWGWIAERTREVYLGRTPDRPATAAGRRSSEPASSPE